MVGIELKYDGVYMATSIYFHVHADEEKTLIEFNTEDGQRIGVELRGGLTAALKKQIDATVSARPEISTWEGYTGVYH